MKKLNVYVVGFEADPINGGVSGYNWFSKKEDADKSFIESKTTRKVELFLEENDWENSFA